jgi:hypothetical protein
LKLSLLGIIASMVALVSLFLPWFSIELWTENLSSTMNFTAHLYQLTGTVEGVTKSMFLIVWFNAIAFVLMIATAVTSMVASIFSSRKKTMLLALSCSLALVAMIVFAYGLAGSSFAVENLNPGYTIGQFPEGSFGLSAERSMQYSHNYSWSIGIGFWLALASVVLALLSALVSKNKPHKT